ncbi:MAG: hypothetical protein EOR11_20140 [Mesorhizobium sp.]|uniref:hypothetical protein n=1 Tax=Mesorhizobium sp. TaxID=1871066 RepID=UPI000FEA6780|nr:hypothetical protein [Mesorhizobium sp.]RWP84618.1 MAG: hypothetical protein EOR11_20140 [Mesorhizobium sp.]
MIDDRRPSDGALILHARQPIAIDDDDLDLIAKRQHNTATRAAQGDRIDWKQHLVNAHGYHNIPDTQLSLRTKQARTHSIKAAAERRQRRREKGIAVHYGRFAWKRLGQAKRDQFDLIRKSLAWIGPRWDANRDFGYYDESGGGHLDHLFRFGTAIAAPKTPWIQHYREGL